MQTIASEELYILRGWALNFKEIDNLLKNCANITWTWRCKERECKCRVNASPVLLENTTVAFTDTNTQLATSATPDMSVTKRCGNSFWSFFQQFCPFVRFFRGRNSLKEAKYPHRFPEKHSILRCVCSTLEGGRLSPFILTHSETGISHFSLVKEQFGNNNNSSIHTHWPHPPFDKQGKVIALQKERFDICSRDLVLSWGERINNFPLFSMRAQNSVFSHTWCSFRTLKLQNTFVVFSVWTYSYRQGCVDECVLLFLSSWNDFLAVSRVRNYSTCSVLFPLLLGGGRLLKPDPKSPYVR